MTNKFHVIFIDTFDMDHQYFDTKAEAFHFVERLISNDRRIDKKRIKIFEGNQIFFNADEQVIVKVNEDKEESDDWF